LQLKTKLYLNNQLIFIINANRNSWIFGGFWFGLFENNFVVLQKQKEKSNVVNYGEYGKFYHIQGF